jgi:enamine deaminase RidA (YjgF/YER057c/UK114 family)
METNMEPTAEERIVAVLQNLNTQLQAIAQALRNIDSKLTQVVSRLH